jgi:hypothetical protein
MIVDLLINTFTILLSEEESAKLIAIIESLIAMFNKNFEKISPEFFILMKITPDNSKEIISLM